MGTAAAQTLFTPEEYIVQERKAHFKSEYLSGRIVAMSGASRAHNLIYYLVKFPQDSREYPVR